MVVRSVLLLMLSLKLMIVVAMSFFGSSILLNLIGK